MDALSNNELVKRVAVFGSNLYAAPYQEDFVRNINTGEIGLALNTLRKIPSGEGMYEEIERLKAISSGYRFLSELMDSKVKYLSENQYKIDEHDKLSALLQRRKF